MDGFIAEFGGAKNGFFRRNIYLPQDDDFDNKMQKVIKDFKNTDVYRCIYSYETEEITSCNIYGDMYIDLDLDIADEKSFEKVKRDAMMTIQFLEDYFKIPRDMFQIYFSGAKGFHVIIPAEILGISPCKDLNTTFKAIAVNVADEMKCETIDTRIYDRKRLFRLPNSINSKTGLYKVPISSDMLWVCTLESIQEWASEPREIEVTAPRTLYYSTIKFRTIVDTLNKAKDKTVSKERREFIIPSTPKKLLPCVKEILSIGSQKGQRNNTTVALASSLMQSGKQLQDVIEILNEWNELNDPPLDEKEINTTATSAYEMLRSGKTYGCASFRDIGMCVGGECKLKD